MPDGGAGLAGSDPIKGPALPAPGTRAARRCEQGARTQWLSPSIAGSVSQARAQPDQRAPAGPPPCGIEQKADRLIRRQRRAEQIALPGVAPMQAQELALLLGLHTFRDHLDAAFHGIESSLPSCASTRATAASSASSACSRRTCSGCAASTPSRELRLGLAHLQGHLQPDLDLRAPRLPDTLRRSERRSSRRSPWPHDPAARCPTTVDCYINFLRLKIILKDPWNPWESMPIVAGRAPIAAPLVRIIIDMQGDGIADHDAVPLSLDAGSRVSSGCLPMVACSFYIFL